MIYLRVRPEFSQDDFTEITLDGPDEDSAANVLLSRLQWAGWETEEGDQDA